MCADNSVFPVRSPGTVPGSKTALFNFAVLMGALLCLPQIGEHPSWLLFYHLSYLHAKSRVIHLKKTKRNARFTEKLQILGKQIRKCRSRCKYPHRKWICPHRPSTKQIPGKHQRKHCIRCKYLYQYLQPCSILLLYNRSHYSINHSQNQPQNVNGRWQRQTKSGRSH